MGLQKPIPPIRARDTVHPVYRSPVHHRTKRDRQPFMFTPKANSESPINLTFMALDSERKTPHGKALGCRFIPVTLTQAPALTTLWLL